MIRRILSQVSALAILAMLSGCSHYQLGTSGQLTFASLYIAPVTMRAQIPQAQPILGSHIMDSFLRDGRISLVNGSTEADAILQITVRDYQRSVATVRPGDTGLARKLEVNMSAEITLTETKSGRDLIHQRIVTVKRDVFTDSGQQQGEYQILPLLAQDLAAKVSHMVLDTW